MLHVQKLAKRLEMSSESAEREVVLLEGGEIHTPSRVGVSSSMDTPTVDVADLTGSIGSMFGSVSKRNSATLETTARVVQMREPLKKPLTTTLTVEAVQDFRERMKAFLNYSAIDSWETYLQEDLRITLSMDFAVGEYERFAEENPRWWMSGDSKVNLDVLCEKLLRNVTEDTTRRGGQSLITALESVQCTWFSFEDMAATNTTWLEYQKEVNRAIDGKISVSVEEASLAMGAILRSLKRNEKFYPEQNMECFRKQLAREGEALKKRMEGLKLSLGTTLIMKFIAELKNAYMGHLEALKAVAGSNGLNLSTCCVPAAVLERKARLAVMAPTKQKVNDLVGHKRKFEPESTSDVPDANRAVAKDPNKELDSNGKWVFRPHSCGRRHDPNQVCRGPGGSGHSGPNHHKQKSGDAQTKK